MPKNLFKGEPQFQHGEVPAVGVLLVNLGSPDAPTAEALNPYLKQFLSDPRVIELSRPVWWVILNFFILTRRPKASAELYKKVWTDEGSPLLVTSQKITRAVESRLQARLGTPVHCRLGMTYGKPSVPAALAELQALGCRRMLMLPLYSHYSSTSTGASFDAVMKELMTWRRVPELRTIHQFHDEPGHVKALAAAVRELWSREGEPDKLLFSFHGIPQRYFDDGDPYHCMCHKTARLVAEELELPKERYQVSFQSLFGREEWIKPYTDVTLKAMAGTGIKRVDVMCPGFIADCLETLEEIDEENRHYFMEAGGEQYRYIPCLNDRDDHMDFMADLVERNLAGWVESEGSYDAAQAATESKASRARAEALRQAGVRADGGYGT